MIIMIYFDNASSSFPKAQAVADAMYNAVMTLGSAGRGAYTPAVEAAGLIDRTRNAIAGLFGCPPQNVALTGSCTIALNAAINSFAEPGDKVAITCTEHNSVLRPLYLRKAEPLTAGLDGNGQVDLDRLEALIKSGVKLCLVNHASNVTGAIIPDIGRIGRLCQEYGVTFIVDAAQSAGHTDIDMRRDNIDILCFSGHKGLGGPQGTGGMCVTGERKLAFKPFIVGGSGFASFSKEQPSELPELFEAGTQNAHSNAGLLAALDALAPENAALANRLTSYFIEKLSLTGGVTIYAKDAERCPVVSFNIGAHDSASVADELCSGWGIACRPGTHCAPLMHEALGTAQSGAVRFGFSHNNTFEEVDTAIAAIQELARLS